MHLIADNYRLGTEGPKFVDADNYVPLVSLFTLFLISVYLLPKKDPYGLKKIPAISRSRIVDAYTSGTYWRFFFPRLFPYAREGYYKVSP